MTRKDLIEKMSNRIKHLECQQIQLTKDRSIKFFALKEAEIEYQKVNSSVILAESLLDTVRVYRADLCILVEEK